VLGAALSVGQIGRHSGAAGQIGIYALEDREHFGGPGIPMYGFISRSLLPFISESLPANLSKCVCVAEPMAAR
jgi:TnpA family transposase